MNNEDEYEDGRKRLQRGYEEISEDTDEGYGLHEVTRASDQSDRCAENDTAEDADHEIDAVPFFKKLFHFSFPYRK